MNVLLGPAPSGTKAVPGAGEGSSGRRDQLDGGFAAALAETAGESGEETVADEASAQKSDEAGAFSRLSRRVGARHAHEAHERLKSEVATQSAGVANEPDTEPRTKEARRAVHKAHPKGVTGKETR